MKVLSGGWGGANRQLSSDIMYSCRPEGCHDGCLSITRLLRCTEKTQLLYFLSTVFPWAQASCHCDRVMGSETDS